VGDTGGFGWDQGISYEEASDPQLDGGQVGGQDGEEGGHDVV